MKRWLLVAGLAAVGAAVALFPLYVQLLFPQLLGESEGREFEEVKGVIEAVDEVNGYVQVSGVKVAVRGRWTKDSLSLRWRDVLAELRPGQRVVVKYYVSENWRPWPWRYQSREGLPT